MFVLPKVVNSQMKSCLKSADSFNHIFSDYGKKKESSLNFCFGNSWHQWLYVLFYMSLHNTGCNYIFNIHVLLDSSNLSVKQLYSIIFTKYFFVTLHLLVVLFTFGSVY